MLFVCSVAWLFFLGVSTSASDWLERLISEMTYNVLMGTLNPTRSLTLDVSAFTSLMLWQRPHGVWFIAPAIHKGSF